MRYVDDFVMEFQHREYAEAIQHALEKRGEGKPETFDFLGFTHFCALRRKDGRFVVRRKTIGKRLGMKVTKVAKELKCRRHDSVADQDQ